MSTVPEQVELDFLQLADHAEVLNGKLYMMGGAWDRLHISDINTPVALSIVIGVLVPWSLTNEPHQLQIRIEDEDGSQIHPDGQATLNMGRPVTATKGQCFRAMTVLGLQLALPKFGAFRVIASVAGQSEKQATFYAVDAAQTNTSPTA